MSRKNRSPEEKARRAKIRELLQMANIDSIYVHIPKDGISCYRVLLLINLLHSTTTSPYTDCSSNLYAGLPSYLLILFSALSAFAVVG